MSYLLEKLQYHIQEFALKRDYDWELQHLGDLNLSPEQLKIAKDKILKAKKATERTRAYYQANKDNPAYKAKMAAKARKYYSDNKDNPAFKAKEAARKRESYHNNPEQIAAKRREYYQDNKEKIAARQKKYCQDNKEKVVASQKKWYQDNKEKIAAKDKRRYQDNKEQIVAQHKKYYQDNKEKIAARQKKYCQDNKEKVVASQKKWRDNNPGYHKNYQKKWYQDNKEEIKAKQRERYQQKKNQSKNESLIESLQFHLDKIYEGEYFWDENETGEKLEVLFDPSPKELQDFLKDYPICKAVSDGYGHWIFAYGQKICHDTLDLILHNWAKKNNVKIKNGRDDSHLSVTKSGLILGAREANSFEQSLYGFMDWGDSKDSDNLTPIERLRKYKTCLKQMLTSINQIKRKYSWLKPSPSLIEEISIALKGKTFRGIGNSPYYYW